ncbi:MAG: peptidoglycan-binding domain-containing protein [Bacillota bacterium]|nr:peptidoglycan-binding domain-containing protein [Bacillota bacterium]
MRITGVIGQPVLTILLISLFLGFVGGCSSSESARTDDQTTINKKIPSDKEIIESLTPEKVTVTQQDEDLQELKHWQYRAAPREVVTEGPVISYQIITEEQLEHIFKCLIEGGYLTEYPEDKYTFQNAVQRFQQDNGLIANGELDASTLEALFNLNQDL